jgi:hypothetical protein
MNVAGRAAHFTRSACDLATGNRIVEIFPCFADVWVALREPRLSCIHYVFPTCMTPSMSTIGTPTINLKQFQRLSLFAL